MKKSGILFLCMTAIIAVAGFTSCENDKELDANVTFNINQTSFDVVNYGQPVMISGTATAESNISSITFTSVKKEGENYVALGDPQNFTVTGSKTETFNMEFFVDNKTMTHIEVKATVGKASKSTYIAVASVEGEATGSAFVSEVMLRADTLVWNNQNHPDQYPNPNTGARSATPSYFSIHGVDINGEKKHVLSVDEMRSVNGLNGSFCFLNVLQNTSNNAYIGSQRGYMFSALAGLGGGTTGRQCDLYEIEGKAINAVNADKTEFKIIAGSWIGGDWKEDRYKFVDSLFVVIGNEASTEAAKLRAFYLLGKIQERLDNATLGVAENPTSLGSLTYARRRTNAGTSGTTAMVENFRAGDYIILRSERINNGISKYYYGIMQIVQIYDDTQAFVNVDGVGQKIGQEEAHQLFMKPLILNIKVQTEL